MRKRPIRAGLLLVLLLAVTTGCQWLQNEFFFIDKAHPEPPPALPGAGHPW